MYLTPAAIGYLTELILALVITGYVGYRLYVTPEQGRDHHALVTAIYAISALLVGLLFIDAAFAPTQRLISVYMQNTVIGLLLTVLLQFAYTFPQRYEGQKLERRLILSISLVYTLFEAGFAIYRGSLLWREGIVRYRPFYFDLFLAAGFLLIPLTFIREVIAASPRQVWWRALWKPDTQHAKTARAFAMIFLIPFALILLVLARNTSIIHPAVFQSTMSLGLLSILLLFALTYLNALPQMISFQVRFAGVTLVVVLAVFGTVGWVIAPTHTADYCPSLADQQTLHFVPNDIGGYDVAQVPYSYETDLGTALEMEFVANVSGDPQSQTSVPFTFPFYGQIVDMIWVSQSGAVGIGQRTHYPSMEYYYGSIPAIFPLFVALDSRDGGGVYANQIDDRLVVTWHEMQGWHEPDLVYTFQLVLYSNGEFDIAMHDVPEQSYDYNTSPFSLAWVSGATPGLAHQSPQRIDITALPLQTGPEGTLHDHYLAFREHMHPLLAPVAVLVVISSLVVIVVFPTILYRSLSQPLNALLAGVRQVQTGDLDTTMPIYYHDEVGYLAQAFNENLAQLRALISGLETRVEERTRELAEANEQLQSSNEDLSAYAHTVAHDLKGPLSIIIGFSSLLVSDDVDLTDETVRTSLEAIDKTASKTVDIINALLLLARVREADDIELEDINMALVIDSVLSHLGITLGMGDVHIRVPETWPVVSTYIPWLEEVWTNYISNAIKYGDNPQAGNVPVVELGGELTADGSAWRFFVRDNGLGLTEEQQVQVFTPFTRLHTGQAEGHGLGLSIVLRIVNKLGGEVGVQSDGPGKGSTFWFTLPVGTEDVS